MMRAIVAFASLALVAIALSGCVGNSVTVAGQGATSGSQSKTINCGTAGQTTGHLAYGNQGAGQMNVKVTDGKGATIHNEDTGYTAGQGGQSSALKGEAGTWTLSVNTGFGYAGQWAVTLSC